MPLRVTRLRLRDFRSYERFEMDPGETITIVVGPNAVGKTNIVEAIQLLTAGSSFRNPSWGDCVRWGSQEAFLALEAEGDGRKLETTLTISSAGKRTYTVNGTVKRRMADVAGKLACVVFTPDDLRMVKDSAEKRRAALDGVGDQLSRAYNTLRGEYEKTVRQRNAALRGPEPDARVLAALTEKLIETGSVFSAQRKRLFGRLSSRLTDIYPAIVPGENLDAVYESSWVRKGLMEEGEGAFAEALRASRSEEQGRGTTLVGPHRDEIRFLLNGRDARVFASQGQQRSIALSWKLAEVSVITDIARQPPVLLLDDVMSELDEERRHALAAFVGEAAQTFVTTTNIGYFEKRMIEGARVVGL